MQPLDPLPPVMPPRAPRKPGERQLPEPGSRDGAGSDPVDESPEEEPESKRPEDDDGHLIDEYA